MLEISKTRTTLSYYLIGKGIEIGALHGPLEFAHGDAHVKYADRMATKDLRVAYPSIENMVNVDYVLKDNRLPVDPGSLDFIIGNHVIEHIVDPLGALKEWARVLKDDGLIFMAFPIPKYCGDDVRKRTSAEHLIEDFETSRVAPSAEHLLAYVWAYNPSLYPDPDEIGRVLDYLWRQNLWEMDETAWSFLHKSRDYVIDLLQKTKLDIHQHVFELDVLRESLEYLSAHAGIHLSVEDLSFDKGAISECIMILRKHSVAPNHGVWGPRARAAEARELYLTEDITFELDVSRQRLAIIDATRTPDAIAAASRLANAEIELARIKSSLLWRFSAPLRTVAGAVSRK